MSVLDDIQFELNSALEFADYPRAERMQRIMDHFKVSHKTPAPLPTDGAEPAEAAWNSIAADEHNKWSALSLDERDTFIAFAAALAHPPKPQAVTDAMVKAARSVPPIPNRGPNVFDRARMRSALDAALAASQSEGGK